MSLLTFLGLKTPPAAKAAPKFVLRAPPPGFAAVVDFSDVKRNSLAAEVVPTDEAVRRLVGQVSVHAHYEGSDAIVECGGIHPFIMAAHEAFYHHYPLVLTPDAVWFCIAQGFAAHVNRNAEALRHMFVDHEGRKKLIVIADDEPDWPAVVSEFASRIKDNVGAVEDMLEADFSTTGLVERCASQIVMMDAFQNYFSYVVMMGCGIPSFGLTGVREDWLLIRRRVDSFIHYGLEHWVKDLAPVLDKIIETIDGNVNHDFWRSYFHYRGGSHPSSVTGWINVFFPFVTWRGETTYNACASNWQDGFDVSGLSLNSFKGGLSSAPGILVNVAANTQVPIRFLGGLVGVRQDPTTLALQPEFGWAVVDDVREKQRSRREEAPPAPTDQAFADPFGAIFTHPGRPASP